MNYIVYKTTNKINGKVYVGVHKTENPDIFDGYIGCGVTKKDLKPNVTIGFPVAVRKYGYDNFYRETLFVFPGNKEGRKQAYEKEAEIVTEEWVCDNNNYNISLGGFGALGESRCKQICQYNLDGTFVKIWNSITEANKALNLNSIANCVAGNSKYCGEWQWKYFDGNTSNIDPVRKKEKTVYQFDLQGNLIKVWKSLGEASRIFNNPNVAKTAIEHSCSGASKQSYGYYWSYKNKFEYDPFKKNKIAVACYNDDGEFIKSYTSLKDACDELNVSEGVIKSAIKGYHKRCKNLRWRYFYGNTSNIKPLNN